MRTLLLACFLFQTFLSFGIDLDAIINSATAGSTIQLQAGVYTTSGVNESGSFYPGPQLKQRVSLIGKGQGRTIIVLTQPEDRSLNVIWGLGGNAVSDLTIDCGVWTNSTTYSDGKRNGLYIQPGPAPNRVSRVSVIRTYGNYSTLKEGFGIIVEGSRTAITDCTVSDPMGDYVQAFSIAGSAVVQNCKVLFPPQTLNSGITCFGQGSGTNVSYLNCLSVGGSSGFYFDTGNVKDLRIENCVFKDAPVGIQFRNQYQPSLTQTVDRVTIKSNSIYLLPQAGLQSAIVLNNTRLDNQEIPSDSSSINNVTIQGNYIGYSPSAPIPIVGLNERRAVSTVSNCTNPVVRIRGNNNISLIGNTYQTIPSGEQWKHRNKWSSTANFTQTNEAAITILTN